MLYRKLGKTGLSVSVLGFGAMRLPVEGATGRPTDAHDPNKPIDEKKAMPMIEYAIDHGVNYFDSAYAYHAGRSEIVLGKGLKACRDKVMIATKLPVNLVKGPEDFERFLASSSRGWTRPMWMSISSTDSTGRLGTGRKIWACSGSSTGSCRKAGRATWVSPFTMISPSSRRSSTATTGSSARYSIIITTSTPRRGRRVSSTRLRGVSGSWSWSPSGEACSPTQCLRTFRPSGIRHR